LLLLLQKSVVYVDVSRFLFKPNNWMIMTPKFKDNFIYLLIYFFPMLLNLGIDMLFSNSQVHVIYFNAFSEKNAQQHHGFWDPSGSDGPSHRADARTKLWHHHNDASIPTTDGPFWSKKTIDLYVYV
jgi:hypothetical protein